MNERYMRRVGWMCTLLLGVLAADAGATLPMTNGLVFWVKADAGVQTNANGIYLWEDQSGLGNHATQIVAGDEPALAQNVAGPRNNKPVVRFAYGSTDGMRFTLANAVNYSGMTFVFVASHGSSQDPREVVIGSGSDGTPGIRWALGMGANGSEGLGWAGTGGGTTFGSAAGLLNDTFYVQSFVKTKGAGSGWSINSGQSEWTAGNVTSVSDGSFPNANFEGVLGLEKTNVASFALSGDMAEVLIYSNALSGAALDQTRAYLAEKWVNSTPEDYLALWLKADTGVQTNADGVYLWQDKSWMGHHASQGTASYQPTLVQSVAGVLSDKPAVRFDGGDTLGFFLTNAYTYSGLTFVFMASHGATRSGDEVVIGSGEGASLGIRWGLSMGNNATWGLGWGKNSTVPLGDGTGLANSTFYLQSYVKTKSAGWSINSGESATSVGTVTSVADDSFPSANFVGALGSEKSIVPSYALSGDLAEVRIYRMTLTSNWLAQVRAELVKTYFTIPRVGTLLSIK